MDLMGTIGSMVGGDSNMAENIMEMVQNAGGMDGVVSKFKDAGMGEQVQSWLGDGENMAIGADAIQKVFGSEMVSGFAQKMGLEPEALATQISNLLPSVISSLSSGGSWTDMASGLMGQFSAGGATDALKKLF